MNLDRLDAAREETLADTAKSAVKRWEKQQQARARRKAQDLERDPVNTLFDLEASAFGCDWLIRQWQAIAAPLALGRSWDQRMLAKAQRLLGYPDGIPGPDADPPIRTLWQLAAAAAPTKITNPSPQEDDPAPPADPITARSELRLFINAIVDRLEALRDESWSHVEGPEREAVIRQAIAADISKDGQLRHRYAKDADRSCSAAIRLFLNLRDRRRRELLEISKEARHCDTPRAPVGGGWWREPISDPAPPGFTRIDSPIPDDASRTSPETAQRSEPISPAETESKTEPNPHPTNPLRNEPAIDAPGAPKRTEPNSNPDRPAHRVGRSNQNKARHRSNRRR